LPEPPITAHQSPWAQTWGDEKGVRDDGPWRVWMPGWRGTDFPRVGLYVWRTSYNQGFPWNYERAVTGHGMGVAYVEEAMMIGSWNLSSIEELDALNNHREHLQTKRKFYKEYRERTHSPSSV